MTRRSLKRSNPEFYAPSPGKPLLERLPSGGGQLGVDRVADSGIKSVRYDGSMPVPALSCFQRSGLNPTAANTLRRNTMTANTTASISLAILVSLACSLPVLASQPSIERLDSGLRIVFFPDPSSSVFVSSVVVLAGSAQEPDAQRGSAHFLEHLLFGKSLSRSR